MSRRMSRRVRRAAFLTALAASFMLGLLPRPATATPMHGTMVHGVMPATGTSMTPHAPTEIVVSDGLKRVLQGLLCQCGCNLDAYQCQQTMTCNVSTAMWDQAAELVDGRGMSADDALALFATDYGEYVLASPTKRGFNLAAWYLPFVVLALGAAALASALRGWRPGAAAPAGPPVEVPDADRRYVEQIERELLEED